MDSLTAVSVEGLLLLLAKAALAIGVALYLAGPFSRSPAAVRHQLWVGLLVVLAAIPLWTWLAPAVNLPLVSPGSLSNSTAWSSALVYGYFLIVALRGAGLLASIARVARIALNGSEPSAGWKRTLSQLTPPGRVALRSSGKVDTPITLGFLRPLIIVPAQLRASTEERRMILQHELEHIRRADWLTQLLGQLVGILFWPVPGMRRVLTQLSLEAEQACDDRVLALERNAPEYAALLLKQARARHLPASVALGRPSELARRINHLCEPTIDHSAAAARSWMLPVYLLLALPVASLQLSEQVADRTGFPDTMGVNLGRYVPATGSAAAPPIHLPSRPVEVTRAPHMSYVVAQEILELPEPDMAANSPDPEPGFTFDAAPDNRWQARPLTTPVYPESARRRGLEGDVVVVYDLTASGAATNIRIHSATPSGVFEQSVLDALASRHYDQSEVVLQDLETAYRFRLRDSRARASPR